ncbi:MAG: hypothetical protein HDT37_06260 [Clostridiales bacterium]|nr:hypothetical protein [Clostridiales bacterium]
MDKLPAQKKREKTTDKSNDGCGDHHQFFLLAFGEKVFPMIAYAKNDEYTIMIAFDGSSGS